MNKPPPATNCSFPLAFFLAAAFVFPFFFCSCSDDPVATAAVQSHLILDWEDEQSLPVERLSVFIETSSNVRRIESFSVKSGDFTWNVDSPIVFQAGNGQWVGWPHLEPPNIAQNKRAAFPLGNYEVECVDAAGKKDKAVFAIMINAALLDATSDKVEGLVPAPQKRVAVYSDGNELLYFDAAKNNWLSDAAIFSGVKDSAYYRNAVSAGSALCFMPKVYKEKKEKENGEQSDGLE